MTCTSPIVYLFVFFNICKIVIHLKYNKVVVIVVVVNVLTILLSGTDSISNFHLIFYRILLPI